MRPALGIAVSDLDAYAYYRSSDMTADEFLARIRREEPRSEKAAAGTRVHALIEELFGGREAGEGPPVSWECEARLPALAATEVWCSRNYEIDGRNVVLRGRVDGVWGFTAVDWKSTFSAINVERYLDSWQWRAYLVMLGPEYRRFRYQVFRCTVAADGSIRVPDMTHFDVYRYAGMEDDVCEQVEELAEHLTVLGWDGTRAPWR